MRRLAYFFTLALAIALGATTGSAQDGKLKIKVSPKQAYVFVDGNAIREGNQSISLSPGKHTVVVVNYGYKISTQDVTIEAGKSTPLDVKLDPYGDKVAGPFGDVQFDGDPRAAVLSNGTTPGYFVGHVDEFNNDWIWHQNLLLPPGTHHITVTHEGKTLWSGDVNVVANKKVVVYIKDNKQKTENWSRGEKMKDLPRFKVGVASAQIAVAPATGNFSASSTNINCGQSSTLNWNTADTVDANISGIGTVQPSGSQSVSPHATTDYAFTATGPGGTVKGDANVNVNTKVDASISANPAEVHYRKIGDKVVTQDSTTLTWQTSNADSVTVDGQKVELSGSETEKPEPADTSQVPEGQPARTIDENKAYSLNATNVCGGSATETANVHIVGSVEPIPTVTLQSIFYPTDYPDKRHPQVGLVKSQEAALSTLADGFKKYLEYDPDAKLSVEAHADARGSKPYNQDLSERRVERIKAYLVEQGISSDKVETAAYGKDQPMPEATVKELEDTNPVKPPKSHLRAKHTDWLAYNRRADIILMPSGKKSAQFYPNGADDVNLIWQLPKPSLKKVEKDQ
ncbi:MAG TPA: OmpA family protein [Candidatus Baltobacteraceae bacterium]|nr:OmpA family protein [Candidatus Baltobacteraceae bacterium]